MYNKPICNIENAESRRTSFSIKKSKQTFCLLSSRLSICNIKFQRLNEHLYFRFFYFKTVMGNVMHGIASCPSLTSLSSSLNSWGVLFLTMFTPGLSSRAFARILEKSRSWALGLLVSGSNLSLSVRPITSWNVLKPIWAISSLTWPITMDNKRHA